MRKLGFISLITGIILLIIGIVSKLGIIFPVLISNGTDGPTSVFYAGTVGDAATDWGVAGIAAGIILGMIGVILLKKKK